MGAFNVLKRIIILPRIYFSLKKDVKKQKLYLEAYLPEHLNKVNLNNDGSVDEEDISKIKKYYGLGVPAILGESFCTLRGSIMDQNERECSTLSGAITGLFDDFFDKNRTNAEHIKQMLDTPENINPINDNQKLSLELYKLFLNKLPNQALTKEFISNIYKVQLDTLKQEQPTITNQEILDITNRKGGYSVLFFRSVFGLNLDESEYHALFNLGALMQLGNDIFDVYKDHNSKIYTLVTRTEDIKELKIIFIKQHILTNKLLLSMNYPIENRMLFINKINLGLSRCYVCLNQLEKLQKKTSNIFNIELYTRKEIICDMEKPLNILKSLFIFVKQNEIYKKEN